MILFVILKHICVNKGEENESGAMSKTVLIVEDNELNMKLFHDLVQSLGCKILQTRNGIEALGLVREHNPDLVIMDIQMPEVSGLDVTRWIREDKSIAHTPIVAVTAFAMKGDEERIRAVGCDAYLSKPIAIMPFLQTVKHYLGIN
jgi:two-component system, cell cycle response regulator DivK